MWILTDEAMEHILGGNFIDVVETKHKYKDASIANMKHLQTKYKSHTGFRKFYRKTLEVIINVSRIIPDKSILGKIILYLVRL